MLATFQVQQRRFIKVSCCFEHFLKVLVVLSSREHMLFKSILTSCVILGYIFITNKYLQEFELLQSWGLSETDLAQATFAAARASFCNDPDKKELMKELRKVFESNKVLTAEKSFMALFDANKVN